MTAPMPDDPDACERRLVQLEHELIAVTGERNRARERVRELAEKGVAMSETIFELRQRKEILEDTVLRLRANAMYPR